MIQLLNKHSHLGLNDHIFTEPDVRRLCRRERIRIVEIPLRVPGFYMVCGGRRFLNLDNRLRGVRWLHVALHELGHHYWHVAPNATAASFYQVSPHTKEEQEAEAFALIAMIPERLLRTMLAWEIEEAHGYTRDMIEKRLKVLHVYGV